MKLNENGIHELLANYELVKPRIIERFANKITRDTTHSDRVLKPIRYTNLMMEYVIDVTDFIEEFEDDENGAYIVVINNMLNVWNTNIDEISNIAKFNTPRLLPSNVQTMGSMLGVSEMQSPMVVVTNNKLNRGAGAILYKSTEEKVKELLGTDFYILPSSTHEVLCVSKREFSPEGLFDMVTEINDSSTVSDEDILDYNIFELKNGKLKALF